MFLTGLMFGSVVIFMLCYKERVLDTQLSVEASVGIGLGIGTLCGLVTMLVRSVGLFMVGLLLGLLVAVATLVGMEELSSSPPRSVWVPLGVLLGLGMIFAVLTLQWQRFFTTLSTAVFGAAVITVALDYFVELFALVLYVYERMKAAPGKPVCWMTWVVLGVWPALTVLGVVIQWMVTAEGYSHTKGEALQPQRAEQQLLTASSALPLRSHHQPPAEEDAGDAHPPAGRPPPEEEEEEAAGLRSPPPAGQAAAGRARLPPQAQPHPPLRHRRPLARAWKPTNS